MCGYLITREQTDNVLLKHRGIKENHCVSGAWYSWFNSLPISSNNLGLEQPLKIRDSFLFFNGEILNFKELNKWSKSDLDYLNNLLIKTDCDVYKIYKESIKWEGFWAISIIKGGSIYSFTDPIGKKQLYYSNFGVCSEIKPLLKNSYYGYKIYNELNFGKHDTNFTTVKRFLPGILYKYEIENRSPFVFLSQDYFKSLPSGNLYDLIDLSVRECLENKINGVSLLLSGGLDSNIILYHTLKYTRDIDVVSYLSPESDLVKEICDKKGLDVNFISPDESNYRDAVYSYEYSFDLGSLLPNYLLFRACKNHVVLSGDGADELFSGYSRALLNDTWGYDVFMELPYYHNIRLDRTSMCFTKENRCPLMSYRLIKASKHIPYQQRRDKKCLRDLYQDKIDNTVVVGRKNPLRHKMDKNYNKNIVEKIHSNLWH